ncbi:MAG: sialidase family protein [Eubacteriales bacterium]|jgi:sialidase-1|nr:sialidase family protein [Eubacteriales bacterium]
MLYKDIAISTVRKADIQNPRHSEASILTLKNGDIMLVWQRFEKSTHGSGDQAPSTIPTICSADGGGTWRDERVLVERPDDCVNVYSPNLIRLLNGDIALIYMKYTQLTAGEAQLASIYIIRSSDEGRTFSPPVSITENAGITISNDCIRRLASGRILLPVCFSGGKLWTPSEHITVGVLYSDNDGQSWQTSPHRIDLPMRGVMEPFVCEGKDGIVMVMRNQLGSVFRARSSDDGLTWSKPQTTGLPAPESCPFIIGVPDSEAMLVVWNNSEYDMHFRSHYGKRSPLTIAVTYDGALTFESIHNIETDPACAFTNPGGTWINNDRLFLTYWTCRYDKNWVMNGLIDLKLARIVIDRGRLKR